MNKQTILIYDFSILFKILFEIKQNLNFEILEVKNDKDFSNLDKNKLGNYVIIAKNQKDNFFSENCIVFEKLPIKINSLIEKLSVSLLKKKYNFQNDIKLKKYKLDLNSREISLNDIKLKLTEREMKILVYLNESTTAQKIENLQKEVWGYASDLETHTVETHIYRLRKKIKEAFNDEHLITSEKNGYLIE
tara:strand:- start:227 stop:799 length:573 start_codon:yes stop_codon:yes gene_type:complete